MTKKKKRILIAILCAAVVLMLFAAFIVWFRSPGVHFFWKFASFNLADENCYIIDAETGTVVNQTTITLEGFENDFDQTARIGRGHFIEIPGYTDWIPEKDREGLWATKKDNGDWHLWSIEYEDQNGNLDGDAGEPFLRTDVYFVDRVPVTRIGYVKALGTDMIFDWEVYAVCADSEEEALRIYQQYQENR